MIIFYIFSCGCGRSNDFHDNTTKDGPTNREHELTEPGQASRAELNVAYTRLPVSLLRRGFPSKNISASKTISLSASHRPLRAFFFPLSGLAATQRGLCGGGRVTSSILAILGVYSISYDVFHGCSNNQSGNYLRRMESIRAHRNRWTDGCFRRT